MSNRRNDSTRFAHLDTTKPLDNSKDSLEQDLWESLQTVEQSLYADEKIKPAEVDSALIQERDEIIGKLATIGYRHAYIKKVREKFRKDCALFHSKGRRGPIHLLGMATPPITARPRKIRKNQVSEQLRNLIATVASQKPDYSQRKICGRVDDLCSRSAEKATPLLPSWKKAGATSLVSAFDSPRLQNTVKKFISTATQQVTAVTAHLT